MPIFSDFEVFNPFEKSLHAKIYNFNYVNSKYELKNWNLGMFYY